MAVKSRAESDAKPAVSSCDAFDRDGDYRNPNRREPPQAAHGVAMARTASRTRQSVSNDQAMADLESLRDALRQAFDGAMDISDVRRIGRAKDGVGTEILRLQRLEIAQRAADYQRSMEELKIVIDDLKQIRDRISQISSSLDTIAQVLSAIGKVAAFLPL